MIFHKFREHELYAKLSKCEFFKEEIQCPAYVISKKVLKVNHKKIEVISNFLTPKNVKELKSFLGLIGYYKRFVKAFSNITTWFSKLQGKGTNFVWKTSHETRFMKLKKFLTSAPTLVLPNFDKEFLVCIDGNIEGIEGVLLQDGRVVYYESKKLKIRNKNYSNHNLELLAIVHA
jgi:hypothetical protein